MSASRKTIRNIYLYDPLDRLMSVQSTQRFYNGTRIATVIQGERETCFFEHSALPLAKLQLPDTINILATDQQTSVLSGVSSDVCRTHAYTPFGYRHPENKFSNLLGFNGELPDVTTGHYMLGQGRRAFNSVLMRFNSPDTLSPFGKGGINAYAYCGNDPVNWEDKSGKFRGRIKYLLSPASSTRLRPTRSSNVYLNEQRVGVEVSRTSSIVQAYGETTPLRARDTNIGLIVGRSQPSRPSVLGSGTGSLSTEAALESLPPRYVPGVTRISSREALVNTYTSPVHHFTSFDSRDLYSGLAVPFREQQSQPWHFFYLNTYESPIYFNERGAPFGYAEIVAVRAMRTDIRRNSF